MARTFKGGNTVKGSTASAHNFSRRGFNGGETSREQNVEKRGNKVRFYLFVRELAPLLHIRINDAKLHGSMTPGCLRVLCSRIYAFTAEELVT